MYGKKFCTDIENVENYEKAKADNFKGWCCHHRLETHNSDGERRVVNITRDELKALDMYFNRPAEELIFLTVTEHVKLHHKGEKHHMYGKHHSEETRKKISETLKGRPGANRGKKYSAEHRKKLSEAHKGKPSSRRGKQLSDEVKKRISETLKGKERHWYTNGEIATLVKECPKGFVPGRLCRK